MSKKSEIFQKFATRHQPEVYNWLTRLDAHLLENGCKTTATLYTSDGAMLDYISKKQKSNDPLAVLPIYEQTNKQQRLSRPTVDGACEYFCKTKPCEKARSGLLSCAASWVQSQNGFPK